MIVTFVCPSSKRPFGGISALYELANGLQRRGHEVHLFHVPFFDRQIDTLDDLSWFEFEPGLHHHVLDGDRPDLPHADVIFGTGARPELGLPVAFVQGIRMFEPNYEAATLRTPCLKVCVARWLIDEVALLGVPREQLTSVPIGIDHRRFRTTTPIDARPRQVAILYNDHPAKGWPVGLGAIARARRGVPDVEVVAFGTMAPPDDLPEWVTYRRDPAPDELVGIYNRTQVFVQASDYEGFGFTAVEAMACGAALVTTDNGGSLEYAVPGETALVAAPVDTVGLARHIEALLRDDRLRIDLATRGAAYVRQFDWDRTAEHLEVILERYVADPAAFQRPPDDVDLDAVLAAPVSTYRRVAERQP